MKHIEEEKIVNEEKTDEKTEEKPKKVLQEKPNEEPPQEEKSVRILIHPSGKLFTNLQQLIIGSHATVSRMTLSKR